MSEVAKPNKLLLCRVLDKQIGFEAEDVRKQGALGRVGSGEILFPLLHTRRGNSKHLSKFGLGSLLFEPFDLDTVAQRLQDCRNGLFGVTLCW